ncbi:MAG: DUF2605 domain-containing protein [Spirulina sp. SIO3F2]|nr:DUF2605 domain-containing protein [Spirulina sp. SIO3F2]
MRSPEPSELVPALLEPLLDDFLYWFGQSIDRLETAPLAFMDAAEQQQLLQSIQTAVQEVRSAKALLQATGVGVAPETLATWHHWVMQGWHVAQQQRSAESASGDDNIQQQ